MSDLAYFYAGQSLFHMFVIAALFALYGLYISKDNFARMIITMMLITIIISFFQSLRLGTANLLVYMVSLTLAVTYALLKKNFSPKKRTLLLLIAIPVLIGKIFILNVWPHVAAILSISVVSVLAFIFICVTDFKNYKNEFGFLSVIATDALFSLSVLMHQ